MRRLHRMRHLLPFAALASWIPAEMHRTTTVAETHPSSSVEPSLLRGPDPDQHRPGRRPNRHEPPYRQRATTPWGLRPTRRRPLAPRTTRGVTRSAVRL